jgi:hypothetical protein
VRKTRGGKGEIDRGAHHGAIGEVGGAREAPEMVNRRRHPSEPEVDDAVDGDEARLPGSG